MPWNDPQREAWRRAGPAVGVRLPLDPFPGSHPQWWNRRLSLSPGYLVGKLHSAATSSSATKHPSAFGGTTVRPRAG